MINLLLSNGLHIYKINIKLQNFCMADFLYSFAVFKWVLRLFDVCIMAILIWDGRMKVQYGCGCNKILVFLDY